MKIKRSELKELALKYIGDSSIESQNKILMKITVARCARLSYMTFDNEIDYEKDIKLHDQLLASKHASPFEHVARAMSGKEYCQFVKGENNILELDEPNPGEFIAYSRNWNDEEISGWCNNFKGFIPYRYLIENGNI
jgi:hypothetical protein